MRIRSSDPPPHTQARDVKALPAIKVDPHAGSWDWTDLQGKLDWAHEGDVVPVKGALAISGGRSLPPSFSLHLEAAKP